MNTTCVQSFNFIQANNYVCPFHNLLPEGVSCCLQTCNFVVIFMLMNNTCVQSFNYKLICVSYDHIYVPIIMYCLRLFVVVYKHVVLFNVIDE